MATFFCQAMGVNAYWFINNKTVSAEGNGFEPQGREWIFNKAVDLDTHTNRQHIYNLTVKIPSDIANNNTDIKCVGVIHDPAYSAPAFLIIKGMYHIVHL